MSPPRFSISVRTGAVEAVPVNKKTRKKDIVIQYIDNHFEIFDKLDINK